MVAIVIALILNTLIVFLAAYVLPGVKLYSFWNAVVVAVVVGVLHSLVHHAAIWLTLPPNFFTYFLCTLVLASIAIYILSLCMPGFEVDGLKWILIFSFIVALFNGLILHLVHA